MKDLDKIIITEAGEMSVRDFFKACLKEVLVNEPPKRFLGDSGWWRTLANGLAKSELIPGGTKPCCDRGKLCYGESPCSYDYQCETEEVDKGLKKLIELL